MGITMQADHVVQYIVDKFLPRGSGSKKLLYVALQPMLYKDDKSVERAVMFLFRREANYTLVLSHTTQDLTKEPQEVVTWDFCSNHDSCWREGISIVLDKLAKEMCEEIDPELDYRDCMFHTHFYKSLEPRIIETRGCEYEREDRIAVVHW